MSRKLYLLLVTLLASGLIAIGCGDDDDDGGGSDEPAQEESGGGSEDSGGGSGATPENVDQAIEQCEQQINQAAQLSADAKKDLENVCKDAASGDEDAVREASEKVCLTILEETGVSGPAADQAKDACKQVNP
jgi:hypothetical protein